MYSTRFRAGLLLMLAAPLAGCVSFGAKPPPILLDLTPARTLPAGPAGSGTAASVIAVEEPATDQRLAVLRIPVQVSATQVAYLKGAAWIERPAHLVQHLLAETLRARGGRIVVEGTPPIAAMRLTSTLREMGFDARSGSVLIRLDVAREDAKGQVETRRFEQTVPGVLPTAEAVGPALNTAANALVAQVAEWVG